MIVLKNPDEVRDWATKQKADGKTVGFVPTMGYLHDGHLSLVERAGKLADKVVVSIFVNPTQFGPNEDFDTYPRDEERDLALCRDNGVDVVFFPDREMMYPEGYSTYVTVNNLGEYLCGASRPNHFRGVTTIVTKLFNIVCPDVAVFGQKDAQQARIIEQMTADLQFGITIDIAPIQREKDGLAMSSRNVRLLPEHRTQAPALYNSLCETESVFNNGVRSSSRLKEIVVNWITAEAPDGCVDYIEIVDWDTLRPVETIEHSALLAIAVHFGTVRLIDNIRLDVEGER